MLNYTYFDENYEDIENVENLSFSKKLLKNLHISEKSSNFALLFGRDLAKPLVETSGKATWWM